jgi:hypothetical protein
MAGSKFVKKIEKGSWMTKKAENMVGFGSRVARCQPQLNQSMSGSIDIKSPTKSTISSLQAAKKDAWKADVGPGTYFMGHGNINHKQYQLLQRIDLLKQKNKYVDHVYSFEDNFFRNRYASHHKPKKYTGEFNLGNFHVDKNQITSGQSKPSHKRVASDGVFYSRGGYGQENNLKGFDEQIGRGLYAVKLEPEDEAIDDESEAEYDSRS